MTVLMRRDRLRPCFSHRQLGCRQKSLGVDDVLSLVSDSHVSPVGTHLLSGRQSRGDSIGAHW
jgi:hypothetical protein